MQKSTMSLFVLWFGLAGIITFFGYLMIAPLIPIGDTGREFSLLNIPFWIQVIISILAVIIITIILIKSTVEFEKYAVVDYSSIKLNRKKWSISLILFPLLSSILIVTLFQFPIPHFVSILATICTPFSTMAVFGTFIGKKDKILFDLRVKSINDYVSIQLICLFVGVLVVNRILVYGI